VIVVVARSALRAGGTSFVFAARKKSNVAADGPAAVRGEQSQLRSPPRVGVPEGVQHGADPREQQLLDMDRSPWARQAFEAWR
jgi:hypothetical protein